MRISELRNTFISTFILPFPFLYIIVFYTLSSVDASQESCVGTVVNGTLFMPILFLPKIMFLGALRETGKYDPSQILKCILIPKVIILFQNNSLNNNTLQLNKIGFHFPIMFHDKPK